MGLVVKNVSKFFGEKTAVDNISFEITKPGVFGLLGTNGAGKTTTIRMMLGIIKKSKGSITWNGKEVEQKNVRFGYLPEERGLYPKTKIYDQLFYFATLKGMSKQEANTAIDYWLKRLEAEEYKNMLAEKLSKGNQQKIQFIASIINEPELIVLDEPFSGLDPVNTKLLKDVILELVQKGKYIVMSSHQMSSIEEFCTDLVILNRGKSVLQGNLEEIKNSYQATSVDLTTKQEVTEIIKQVNLPVLFQKDHNYQIQITSEQDGYRLLEALQQANVPITKFEIKKPSLNDIFIEKVGK